MEADSLFCFSDLIHTALGPPGDQGAVQVTAQGLGAAQGCQTLLRIFPSGRGKQCTLLTPQAMHVLGQWPLVLQINTKAEDTLGYERTLRCFLCPRPRDSARSRAARLPLAENWRVGSSAPVAECRPHEELPPSQPSVC